LRIAYCVSPIFQAIGNAIFGKVHFPRKFA